MSGNIFIHELNILRPTHIAFLCGKGYNEHIKRDFGEKFYEMNKDAINQLSVRKSPVSDIIILKKHQIKDLFGIEGYDSINIVFTIHSSAHMKKDIRSSYEQSLIRFTSAYFFATLRSIWLIYCVFIRKSFFHKNIIP